MTKRAYITRWCIILVCYIVAIVTESSIGDVIFLFALSATIWGIHFTLKNRNNLFKSKK